MWILNGKYFHLELYDAEDGFLYAMHGTGKRFPVQYPVIELDGHSRKITRSNPVRTGSIGGSTEIHEKKTRKTARARS